MKKKDLIKILEKVDDNTEIITVSSNYELQNNLVMAFADIRKYKQVERQFIDDFDGTEYITKVYEQDDEGEDVVIVYAY